MDLLSKGIITMIDKFIGLFIYIIGGFLNGVISVSESNIFMVTINVLVCLVVIFILWCIIVSLVCRMVGVEPGDIYGASFLIKRSIEWKLISVKRYIYWKFFY